VAIEPDATVLGTEDGVVRVPNNVLLESIVRIHAERERTG
jgi:hypothetical protein